MVGRGIIALGVVAGASTVAVGNSDSAPTTPDAMYDIWQQQPGQSVGDIELGVLPDSTTIRSGDLATNENMGNEYGVRLRTLFTPERSGDYRFFLSSDDDSRLFFNPAGTDPGGARLAAFVAGWTTPAQWDRFASQRSDVFELDAGSSYYLEVIGKEDQGDDHLMVGMQIDGTGEIQVVPSSMIEATELGAGGWRTATPYGLGDVPAVDAGWVVENTAHSLDIDWAPVGAAPSYVVRLEGSGEARTVTTDTTSVSFDNLVPLTRYLVEVTPQGTDADSPTLTGVFFTDDEEFYVPVAPTEVAGAAGVSFDYWDTGWWTLTSIADGLEPTETSIVRAGMQAPVGLGDNHGARLRALLTPEASGEYTFFLSSDDDGRLIFNPDGAVADGADVVASVSGWTEQYQWDRYASQRSASFELVAGRQYYIEAMAVQGLTSDHLEVGWSLDGGPIEVIPAGVLEPTEDGAGGWRSGPIGGGVDQAGPTTTLAPTTTVAPTTTTAPSTTTTAPTTTLPLAEPKLRLTFMCRAVDGGDITNDDYDGNTTAFPAGSYVWRVRSESNSAPVDYEVRVGGRAPFHTGTLEAFETQFFATDEAHAGAKVHWDSGSKGTASANESPCGLNQAPTTTAAPTTTTIAPQGDTVFTGATDMAEYGIIAIGRGACSGIAMSASNITSSGLLRSNGDVNLWGGSVDIDGTVSYAGSTNLRSAANIVHDTAVTVADLGFSVTDFAQGISRSDVDFFAHVGRWNAGGSPERGVHFVAGDVNVSGSDVDLDGVTIIATGSINVSGSNIVMSPAAPGLPTLVSGSWACDSAAINLSGSNIEWDGTIVALSGMVRMSASNVEGGDVVAAAVRGSASNLILD